MPEPREGLGLDTGPCTPPALGLEMLTGEFSFVKFCLPEEAEIPGNKCPTGVAPRPGPGLLVCRARHKGAGLGQAKCPWRMCSVPEGA